MNKKNIILMMIVAVVGIIYLNSKSYIYWQAINSIGGYSKLYLLNFWSVVFLLVTVMMCVIKRKEAKHYTKYVIWGSVLGIVITLIMIFVFHMDEYGAYIMYRSINIGTIIYTILIMLYMVACDALSTVIMKKINCICDKKKEDSGDVNTDKTQR